MKAEADSAICTNNYCDLSIPMRITQSESCSGLPPDIPHLKTDMSFPVSYGTNVEVRCLEDRELRGDDVIICNQGRDFQFREKPKCNDIGMGNLGSFYCFNIMHDLTTLVDQPVN